MTRLLVLMLLMSAACTATAEQRQPGAAKIEAWLKEMDTRAEEIKKAGRMPQDYGNVWMTIGTYDWYSEGSARFGAYRFYEPAFQQAMRSWIIHGFTIKGDTLLYATNPNAEFDDSIVGYTVSYGYVEDQRRFASMQTTVVESLKFSDNSGHRGILRLKDPAPETGPRYNIAIRPPDWVEMCGCIVGGSR